MAHPGNGDRQAATGRARSAAQSLKKPERIVALGLIMVLCLLVYRLAEHRLRTRLVETEQTIPDQLNRPTTRPTMRLSSFSVLKALSSCISTRHPGCSRSSYVCSPSIASSWLCLDLLTKKSTKSLLETAKCGIQRLFCEIVHAPLSCESP